MPHVVIKMYAGRSEAQKAALAEEITRAVTKILGYGADSVSVGIEDVAPGDWTAQVYKPDISDKPGTIYKRPGYTPADL